MLTISTPAPIADILNQMITNKEDARKLNIYPDDPEPVIMPFNIDLLYRDTAIAAGYFRFAFAHYYKLNGDMVPDPDMEVLYNPETGNIAAATFQDIRSFQNVYNGKSIDTRMQAELNDFLKIWLNNVIDQQGLKQKGGPEPMPTTPTDPSPGRDIVYSKKLIPGTLGALCSSVIVGNKLTMPPIDRKVYEQVNDIFERMGGEWNKSAKAHVFPESPAATLQKFLAKYGATLDTDPMYDADVKQFFDDIRAGKRDAKLPSRKDAQTCTTLTLADFIEKFKDPIAENIHRRFTPVYDITADMTADDAAIAQLQTRSQELGKPLFTAQEHIAKAAKTLLTDKKGKCLFVIGEMGSGKSSISNAIAHIMGAAATHNLIVCPPHLTGKWEREIRETFPKSTRLQVFQIRSIRDFETAKTEAALYEKTFFILSREKSKLSYYWKPDYIVKVKPVNVEATREDGNGNPVKYKTVEYHRLPHCPVCHSMIVDPKTGTVQEEKQLKSRRQFCQHEITETVQAPDNSFQEATRKCNTPFFTADREGPRRYALADYIAKRHKNFFDLLIIDEVHEQKAKNSAQGQVIGTLAGACRKTISLTGTIFGGKSSSLFYLLYRFSAGFKKQYKYNEEHEFVKKYGIQWTINKESEIQSDGRSSRRKISPSRIEEKPGISPEIILHLIDKAVFINMQDIDNALPSYTETPIECRMAPAQGMRYAAMEAQMKKDLAKALARNDKRMLSLYLQTTLTYPDRPEDPETTYPKEQSLIDTVKAERSQGRRVLVYATHTDQRDITPRLREVLEREGLSVAVMKATVKAEKREAWIRAAVAEGIDCLICNPSLVKTGLDLIDFPTIYYYEIDFNIYTMRQSSRRSWRIGQSQPVQVYFACYANTMQQRALTLVAKKLKAAEMIDGELTDDGLSGYKDEGSLLVDLAKSMLDDIKTDNNTLEGLFQGKAAQAQDMTGFIGYDTPAQARKVIPSPQTPSPRPQPANDLWMTMYAEKIAARPPRRARPAATAEPMLSLF